MNELVINVFRNNEEFVVSSREVALNFKKAHKHVLETIRKMADEILATKFNKYFIESEFENRGKKYPEYLITKDGLILYLFNIQGYNNFKIAYINKFNEMEEALNDIKFKKGDKKHQIECMELLHDLLPEELKQESVSYIKANTVVNKCVSNIYGFPKMLKKAEMNNQMLQDREEVLNDYIKLFEVIQDNSQVADILYKKYTTKLLN